MLMGGACAGGIPGFANEGIGGSKGAQPARAPKGTDPFVFKNFQNVGALGDSAPLRC